MKTNNLLPKWAAIAAFACAPLHAQMAPQPQVSFYEMLGGMWGVDWEGVNNRTYFIQYSLDLKNWSYFSEVCFGDGSQSSMIQPQGASKLFIRLKYLDDPAITSQEEAESADFDSDGLDNLFEVQALSTDPFKQDSEGDQMRDGWEYDNGLDPLANDSADDFDGDGLTNLNEFQRQTKASYYDSDDDKFDDAFEINTPGYDPLVFNDPAGDLDQDGLSDYDELSHGTSSSTQDTDSDGITDLIEITSGSDPLNGSHIPFNASDYMGGVTDPAMVPMGDLGILFNSAPQFTIDVRLRDNVGYTMGKYTTEQESWRVWIGNDRFLNTKKSLTPAGPGTPFSTPEGPVVVDGKRTYQLRIQHLGVAGKAHPDYHWDDPEPDFEHTFSAFSEDFLFAFYAGYPLIEPAVWTGVVNWNTGQSGIDWVNYPLYAVPYVRTQFSSSFSGGDATGPRFRKISHSGRPVPDNQPESDGESDEAAEESYVDAFDLSLHHDTSFASIPLAASDLRLEAGASVRETTWSTRRGLRPNEEITSPFGVSWSSNLCSYIETVETFGSNTTRPTTVNVVDEGGRSQRFGTPDNMETFFPWPSSLTDKKTYLNQLTKSGTDLVLTKKYGNKLTYRPCDAWFMYSSDRWEASTSVVRHRYWRLAEVEDRFGNKVEYDYGTSTCSLIPVEIRAIGRPGQKLSISRSSNGRRIDSITDAENNTTIFHYTDRTITVDGTTFEYPYQELSSVEFPGGAKEHYTYDVAVDPEAELVYSKTTRHIHANLKSIRRDGYAERIFSYGFDRTKKCHDYFRGKIAITAGLDELPADLAAWVKDYVKSHNKSTSRPITGQFVQYGIPRMVTGVSWPSMGIASAFAKTADTQTTYGPVFSAANGTEVTDATGAKFTYTFENVHGEVIDSDISNTAGSTNVSTEWLVYYPSMTLQYKDAAGAVLGSESFEFDPKSGLSLKKTIDFCGNEANWEFGDPRDSSGPRITLENNPDFLVNWADPTEKTDALGRIENYEYGTHRILTKQTDVHGAVAEYTVDAKGRRTAMTIKSPSGTLLRKETYAYADLNFPGFMTKKTREAFSNLSGKTWEQDLEIQYVPDSHGRVWKEITDPSGANLVTIHTYDLNNRKSSTKDARNLVTSFEYDARNRLTKTTFADNTFQSFGYDDNSARIRETDENGNSTLIERDGLGRVIKSARDMDGDGQISVTGDLVTRFAYDAVGAVRQEIDPRGFAMLIFRDDLHRLSHVFHGVPEASADASLASLGPLASSSRTLTHGEFFYDVAKNTGGGLLNPFKPTGTVRHDAVAAAHGQADSSLADSTTYDDVYRPAGTSSEYKPDFSKTTQFNYGNVDASGHESLVTTITDSLGKVTRATRDALGRDTETIDGFGNSDPDLVLTHTQHYTSTGLLWKAVDPLLRHTETEYDSAGRPVKVFQPDPATGLITGNSPITETEYDENGNVSAVIDPLGHRTDFDYDQRNRKWRTRQPAVTDATNPDSPVVSVRPTTTSAFDAAGNEIAVTDARGSTVRKFHDPASRVFKVRTNPQSGNPFTDVGASFAYDITTTTTYDKGGLAIAVEDGNGNITRNAYDGLRRLCATATKPSDGNPPGLAESGFDPSAYRSTNPATALVSYVHDDSGNIIGVTDGGGHETAFSYDGFNRKIATIWDPGTAAERTETSGFNALLHTSRTDGRGHITHYQYDALHRLADVIHRPDTSGTGHVDNRHFTYDKGGKALSVTWPNDSASIRDTASAFDKLDRLTSEISGGVTHTYPEYDKAGNRLRTTYGRTGTTLVSAYDSLNRLATCEERAEASTPSGRTTTYAYDLGGKVTRKTLPNGNATTTTHDKLGRTLFLIEKTSSNSLVSSFDYSQVVGSWPFSHDGVGNVLRCAESHSLPGVVNRVVTNSYDHSNRLVTETINPSGAPAVTTTYGYDLADNRVAKTVGSAVTEYQFGNGSNGANSNQLREYGPSGQAATHGFTYDANGNRQTRVTAAGTETYTWDEENRLTGLTTPAGTYHYTYDHRGRRIVRDESSAGGVLTGLSFSGGTSVQEANGSGTVQVELIRGSDWGGGVGGILFTIRSGQRSYHGYNSRGDVVSTTGGSGTATWQAAYEGFGTRTAEQGTNIERQRANTKEEDPTGLLNEGHRYRDLEAGVFISRDPLGFVDGPNVYTYVRQNPWSKFDPEGLNEANLEGIKEILSGVNYVFNLFAEKVDTYIADPISQKITGLTARQAQDKVVAEVEGKLPGGKTTLAVTGVVLDLRKGRLPDKKDLQRLERKADAVPEAAANQAENLVENTARVTEKASKEAAEATSDLSKKTGDALTPEQIAKDPGSYTNTHVSGKTYHGKGSRARSQTSGRREAKSNNDPHVATDWEPATSQREAFKQESLRLDADGGPSSSTNYNRIEQPGKKYREQDGDP